MSEVRKSISLMSRSASAWLAVSTVVLAVRWMPGAVPRSMRTSPMRLRTVRPALDSGLYCQDRVAVALAARAGRVAVSSASAAVARKTSFIIRLRSLRISARLVAIAAHPDRSRKQERRRHHAEPQVRRGVELAQAADQVHVADLLEVAAGAVHLAAGLLAKQAIQPEQPFGDEVANVLRADHDPLQDPEPDRRQH